MNFISLTFSNLSLDNQCNLLFQTLEYLQLFLNLRVKMVNHHLHIKTFSTSVLLILFFAHPFVASDSISYANTEDDDMVQNSVQNGRAHYEMISRDASMPRYIA